MRKSAPESELQSPIPLGPSSNGEVPPPPEEKQHRAAEELYRRIVDEKSRRLGLSRRDFIDSSCGTLAALWVLNQVSGCAGGKSDGSGSAGGAGGNGFTRDAGYDVPRDVSADRAAIADGEAGYQAPADALEDQAHADAILAGDDFIFDVQVHNRAPKPPWDASVCRDKTPMYCPTEFMREVFVASDTTVGCLSGFPAERGADQPSLEARQKIKQLLDMFGGPPRLVLHANVAPILGAAERAAAEKDAQTFPIAAWKTYPDGGRLNHAAVAPFYETARRANVKIIAAHRGLGGGSGYDDAYSPRDVVAAAKMYPDFSFLVYHSGYIQGGETGPYNETNPSGIDRLIKALQEYGVGTNGNVYAELGSTWNDVSKNPMQAAHAIGKLLRYLGPDRILWGTDSVLTGRPQGQIDRFRAFEIPQSMQATYGYPALTPEVKRKVLGLNAAHVYGVDPATVRRKITNDELDKLKLARRFDRRSVPLSPHPPHGPRTWREYLGFRRWNGEPV